MDDHFNPLPYLRKNNGGYQLVHPMVMVQLMPDELLRQAQNILGGRYKVSGF